MTGCDEDIHRVIDCGKNIDWNKLLKVAQTQNVVGVVFDGIQKCISYKNITKDDLGMTMPMMANWIKAYVSQINKYNLHEAVFHGLVNTFETSGIDLILLKGLGLSKLYPNPSSRSCGDIDIFPRWNDGKIINKNGISACEFINQFAEKKHIKIDYEDPKHSVFALKGVIIENHVSLMNLKSIPFERKIEQTLMEYINNDHFNFVEDSEYTNIIKLSGKTKPIIKTLPPNANYIFLLRHMTKHFRAYQSLNVRQIMDFGVFLNSYKNELDVNKLKRNIVEFKHALINDLFVSIAEMFTGYDLKYAMINPKNSNTYDANRIVNEIFYGKHDYSEKQTKSVFYSVIIMLRQHWKHKYIPDNFMERSLFAVKRIIHNRKKR